MTERVTSITLVLKEDMHEDDAAEFAKSFRYYANVAGVIHNASTPASEAAEQRARMECVDRVARLVGDMVADLQKRGQS